MSCIRLVITGPAVIFFLQSGEKYSLSFLKAQTPDKPTTIPILFFDIISFAFITKGLNLLWWPTNTIHFFLFASSLISSACETFAEIGFSIKTCFLLFKKKIGVGNGGKSSGVQKKIKKQEEVVKNKIKDIDYLSNEEKEKKTEITLFNKGSGL